MTQLAEAYIHLRPFYISASRLEELGQATDEMARTAALRIYEQQVVIEVQLNEGTLWGKITVTGNILLAAYTIYSGYPGAIDATERLCKKANLFGDYVCSSFIKETGATPEQVARVERRTKTPGKLLRALRRLEHLDKAAATMSKESLQSELHAARIQLNGAINGLSDEEKKILDDRLTFHNLPPITDLPEKDTLVADIPKVGTTVERAKLQIGKYLIQGEELTIKPEKRRRLRYRNKFVVDPDDKR